MTAVPSRSVRKDPAAALGLDHPRKRTIELKHIVHGEKVTLLAWGEAIVPEEDGAGPPYGVLRAGLPQIEREINDLFRCWHKEISDVWGKDAHGLDRQLFSECTFLKKEDIAWPERDKVFREFARLGARLFRTLFCNGAEGRSGDGVRHIGRRLREALLAKDQTIRINGDGIVAPWSMLYVPPDPEYDFNDPRLDLPLQGFWGYSHRVEQVFSWDSSYQAEIPVQGSRPLVGMNVDPRLDLAFDEVRPVERIERFFVQKAGLTLEKREDRSALEEAFKQGRLLDEICYFNCHGVVGELDGQGAGSPNICLGDGAAVYTWDFDEWLDGHRLASSPLVFAMSCQAGRIASRFCHSFGATLLDAGANCVLGPYIDIPPLFGRDYAEMFFTEFLGSNLRVGDIVQKLNRRLLDQDNPLGLTIALYRGIDTRLPLTIDLDGPPRPAAPEPTEADASNGLVRQRAPTRFSRWPALRLMRRNSSAEEDPGLSSGLPAEPGTGPGGHQRMWTSSAQPRRPSIRTSSPSSVRMRPE